MNVLGSSSSYRSLHTPLFYFLINHYSYLGYLVYDEGLHVHLLLGYLDLVLTDTPITTICQSVDRLANGTLFTVRSTGAQTGVRPTDSPIDWWFSQTIQQSCRLAVRSTHSAILEACLDSYAFW